MSPKGHREAAARRITDLASDPRPYFTVKGLAEYWVVSRKQIYKQIDAGTLPAIRLGVRLFRIGKADALEFEHQARIIAPPPERAKRLTEVLTKPVKMRGQSEVQTKPLKTRRRT